MSFLCEYISFFRILSNLQYRRAMRQLAILLLRLFPFLTLPNKTAINVLEQASISPVWGFLLGGEKWNRCLIRYVHSGLSQISLPPTPPQPTTHLHSCQHPTWVPAEIYIPDSSSPNLQAVSDLTLLSIWGMYTADLLLTLEILSLPWHSGKSTSLILTLYPSNLGHWLLTLSSWSQPCNHVA